jgi:hypothetical protein
MPLGAPGYYGSEADGSENKEYCTFCYQNGAFMQPEQTLEGMVDASVRYMTATLKFEEAKARELSMQVLPGLKRWKRA